MNRIPRFFHDGELAVRGQVVLTGATHHHLAHVLRMKSGGEVCLFNGDGREYAARLREVGRHQAVVEVTSVQPGPPSGALQTVLAIGISKAKHFDLALQKATELGVSVILPLQTERSPGAGSRAGEKLSAHWRSVAISACEQCGRAELPVIRPVTRVQELVTDSTLADHARLLMDPAGQALEAGGPVGDGVVVCVGPEGGFSDIEVALLAGNGYRRVACGPRILRTETAPLVMLTLVQYLWGDLRPGHPDEVR